MIALRDAEEIRFIFDCRFNDGRSSLAHTAWPPRLRVLEFHEFFNQAVEGMAFPQSLAKIRFGNAFNQPVEGVTFPEALREVDFGHAFNQPVEGVAWPTALEAIHLGHSFDQPLARVVWPVSLRRFVIAQQRAPTHHGNPQVFSQPIGTVSWPDTLEQLELGAWFCGPTEGVVWPSSLVRLVGPSSLGNLDKKHGVEGGEGGGGRAMWPASLQHLTFGGWFSESLSGVTLPASLKELHLGEFFDRALHGVEWPPSLEKLTFGVEFDQPLEGVVWPVRLQYLKFGCSFNHSIADVDWPPCLTHLRFGECFNQPIVDARWPPCLTHLFFGDLFNQPLCEVVWPPALQELGLRTYVFWNRFHRPRWPESLQHLHVGAPYRWHLRPIFKEMWPASLASLTVHARRYWSMEDAKWPGNLQQLFLIGGRDTYEGFPCIRVDRFSWPYSLQRISFADFHFAAPIDDARWPPLLRRLDLGDYFDQPLDKASWPPSLRRLSLGSAFKHPLGGLGEWMPGLEGCTFMFDPPERQYRRLLADITWPAKLRRLIVDSRACLNLSAIPPRVKVVYQASRSVS